MTTTDTIPQRLRAWRGSLSREQAARRLNVSNSTYIRWESGATTPKGIYLAAVEAALRGDGEQQTK